MSTESEENYLKAIYKLAALNNGDVSTKDIAARVKIKPASVSDMLKKLADKQYINYQRYQSIALTPQGEKIALQTIRKHRLWEVFLVEKLNFTWDQVHDMAEELEHVSSDELINRLDSFLGSPTVDPHGDPIPNATGKLPKPLQRNLSIVPPGTTVTVAGVANHTTEYLQLLGNLGIKPGTSLTVETISGFDNSMLISINQHPAVYVAYDVAKHILIP